MKKISLIILTIFLVLIINFLLSAKEPLILDDVHPLNPCEDLIAKSGIIYVVPSYQNVSLASYPDWCEKMRLLNKTFGLHGITHDYHEFLKPVPGAKLQEAISIFEDCFGYKPKSFRPPYNKISPENWDKVEALNMSIYQENFFLRPYCHCQPSFWMKLLNWLIGC